MNRSNLYRNLYKYSVIQYSSDLYTLRHSTMALLNYLSIIGQHNWSVFEGVRKFSRDLMCITWSKGHMALRIGAPLCISTPCLVWCSWVFCRWRYNLFKLSRDIPLPLNWEVIRIYEWELFALCHHPDKSCDHKRCDSGGNVSNV